MEYVKVGISHDERGFSVLASYPFVNDEIQAGPYSIGRDVIVRVECISDAVFGAKKINGLEINFSMDARKMLSGDVYDDLMSVVNNHNEKIENKIKDLK